MPSAREMMESKGIDTYEDRVFLRVLTKAVQKLNPDIGAVYFPNLKILVFYWHKVLIYKVIMDKYNTEDTKIEFHVKQIANTLKYLKAGLIPTRRLEDAVKGFNRFRTGRILT